jgi:hypothetical protein
LISLSPTTLSFFIPCSDSSLREAAKEDAEPDAAQAVRGRFKGFAFDLDQLLKES